MHLVLTWYRACCSTELDSHWVLAGWNAFTHELILQCSKADSKPLVFAFFTSGEQFIQLVHGFGPHGLGVG